MLFIDDNQVNVDAVANVGIVARRTVGPAQARAALSELRVLA